jgi:hypothetical protein
MKKLLLIALVTLLPGCAVWDAFFMTKYDPSEYKVIAEIRTEARQYKADCDNPVQARANAVHMANKTEFFMLFSEQVPNNVNVIAASKELNAIAQGLADSYKKEKQPSAGFCKIKYGSLESNATTMQTIIGKRPR